MIRAVLDANILVSGFPAATGTVAMLIDRWRAGEFLLVVSQHILDEVGRAWTKPYWQARFAPILIERALALLQQDADLTTITATVKGVATHPEDDVVLATAMSAQVDYLVTGDKHLQALGRYQNVTILSPRDFLTLLEQDDAQENQEDDEVFPSSSADPPRCAQRRAERSASAHGQLEGSTHISAADAFACAWLCSPRLQREADQGQELRPWRVSRPTSSVRLTRGAVPKNSSALILERIGRLIAESQLVFVVGRGVVQRRKRFPR